MSLYWGSNQVCAGDIFSHEVFQHINKDSRLFAAVHIRASFVFILIGIIPTPHRPGEKSCCYIHQWNRHQTLRFPPGIAQPKTSCISGYHIELNALNILINTGMYHQWKFPGYADAKWHKPHMYDGYNGYRVSSHVSLNGWG